MRSLMFFAVMVFAASGMFAAGGNTDAAPYIPSMPATDGIEMPLVWSLVIEGLGGVASNRLLGVEVIDDSLMIITDANTAQPVFLLINYVSGTYIGSVAQTGQAAGTWGHRDMDRDAGDTIYAGDQSGTGVRGYVLGLSPFSMTQVNTYTGQSNPNRGIAWVPGDTFWTGNFSTSMGRFQKTGSPWSGTGDYSVYGSAFVPGSVPNGDKVWYHGQVTNPLGWECTWFGLNYHTGTWTRETLYCAIPAFAAGFTDHMAGGGDFYPDFLGFGPCLIGFCQGDQDFVYALGLAPSINDVGIQRVVVPVEGQYPPATAITPECWVFAGAYCSGPQTFDVDLTIEESVSGVIYDQTVQVTNLAPGDSQQVTFPSWTTWWYRHNFTATFVTDPGGSVTTNDTVVVDFHTWLFQDLYVEDFEADSGNMTVTGTASVWQWGAPTSGPGAAYSGSNVWATVLAGNYPNSANAQLTTPGITLPADMSASECYFWMWWDSEASYDGANMKISTDGTTFNIFTGVAPAYTGTGNSSNPLNGQAIWTGHVAGMNAWNQYTMDLSTYGGQTIWLQWDFGSDGSVAYPGFYIDDVTIRIPNAVEENPIANPETFSVRSIAQVGNVLRLAVTVPSSSQVEFEIFDATGRLVATPFSGTVNQSSVLSWNSENVSSGVYFYKVTSNGNVFTGKFTRVY
ncbi:immune inhibitor A [candidate division WOR-3 bacterium]|nr:immune inhibitor A [candidate division WOR-3 bacterium]